MITLEKALNLTLSYDFNPSFEIEYFLNSYNRVLAQDVVSDIDLPPFDRSAMDGYAFNKKNIDQFCDVVEIIPAGKLPEKTINDNQCSKIMTGAIIPRGADCVIPVENIEINSYGKVRCNKPVKSDNICKRGEDVKKGQIVLSKGTIIKHSHIAVMAAVGCINPLLYHKVNVSIASTGDEIIEPYITPDIAKIRNINSYQLVSQIKEIGANVSYVGIIKDDINSIKEQFTKILPVTDVLIFTGGVSMGDFDFIPTLLNEINAKVIYKSIAIQPGRPTVFAKINNKFVFGLPGNPVSSYIICKLIVKPFLLKMMGASDDNINELQFKFPLAVNYERKNSERLAIIPVKINSNLEVLPVDYHGSAHINALAKAQAIAFIPIGVKSLKKGEIINVRPL
ncbi:MAG TPA: molybdopterin molybdotransferase MoeA [Bacteroidales bacterium]|nr:molybdopterin molybdotransferase MoeA [Bacteroidales bacterium]